MSKQTTRDEALTLTIEYMGGDVMAADVWLGKYALKDTEGTLLEKTPEDMHWRIASELERADSKYTNGKSKEFYFSLLDKFGYVIPQGSPMFGIGNTHQIVSLSNCFVIGVEGDDSYGGIMLTDEEQVQLMKRRGGVGHDLGHIRPKDSKVKNGALTSGGIVPFMERYSNTTREVAQGGRRGALMLSCPISHPEIENFIDAKMEQGKVTGANISVKITDDFMETVEADGIWTMKFDLQDGTSITKEVPARKLWDKIIHNAWKSAEPGVMFWSQMIRESIAECYAKYGFDNISTNPCLVYDTKVMVADGRGEVSIGQLAEEGKDVPVYCYDDKGKVVIRTMRNPRLTGKDKEIYRVTLDDGSFLDATPNHKFKNNDGVYVEVKNLKIGESLCIISRDNASFDNIISKKSSNKDDYYWINNKEKYTPEHRLIVEHNINNKLENGFVVHHKDGNRFNNVFDNLEIITKKEHDGIHSLEKIGEGNPFYTSFTEEERQSFILKASKPGETNGRYSGYTEQDLREVALELTESLGRGFTKSEWEDFAKVKGVPYAFSGWRKNQLNGGVQGLSKWAANKLGFIEKPDGLDSRTWIRYTQSLEQGYDSFISDGVVYVNKQCETCEESFTTKYSSREMSVCCGTSCYNKKIHSNVDIKNKIKETRTATETKRKQAIALEQVRIYKDILFELGREPMRKEWESKCTENKISKEIGRKSSPIRNWEELKQLSISYNHRVVSVEKISNADVYNGTVDDYHNFFVGGFDSTNRFGKQSKVYVNNKNCGELLLCRYDSCRLTVLNLYNYVINPFTKEATFNWELFKEHSNIIIRIMDNIVDLELEKIDSIIEKIKNDPESEAVKRTEYELWLKIREKCEQGRRTGVGITAEGDMLAALGYRYGTPEATDFAVEVHKTLAIEVFRGSVQLAKERGHFPIWEWELEKDNPFINRILNEAPEIREELIKYGRRNIALLTIAPTGTVSIMTQTTSGIEPVFLPAYRRRRKINPSDKNSRVDYVDEVGDSWEMYNVFHHKFIDWYMINHKLEGIETREEYEKYLRNLNEEEIKKIVEVSPYHKATSNDVDWVEKIRMQGAIQKWIDHSISCCVVKDTLIETDGGLLYMDEIADFDKIQPDTFEKNTTFSNKVVNCNGELAEVDSFYNNGIKPVMEMQLENGLRITCTDNERFIAILPDGTEDWVELKDLKLGTEIKIA